MNSVQVDLLIAGAGPVSCVVAEMAASQLGWRCHIVEKRNHIAGNCYDYIDENGLLVQKYSPHYFSTDNSEVVNYLSQFTAWLPGNYVVKSSINSELYPFPVNLATLRKFFNRPDLTPETAEQLLQEKREKIEVPQNAEEFILSQIGHELYENFYLGYMQKRWGLHPSELDISICEHRYVWLDEDEHYADHKFKITPAGGYSQLFEKMLDNPLISVGLNTDFNEARQQIPAKAILYTGPIDDYFGKMHGALPWRLFDVEFKLYNEEFYQPCLQINYPNEHNYSRSVEIKHITRQKHPQTVVANEFPHEEGDPYYPVPTTENIELYEKYRELARYETMVNKVYFAGRLARYAHLNTDEEILNGLEVFEQLKADFPHAT